MLALLMTAHRVQTTVCPIDLRTWLRFNPAGREGRLKDLLMSASAAPEGWLELCGGSAAAMPTGAKARNTSRPPRSTSSSLFWQVIKV